MIRPFTDADVDAAAELLAERHARQRAAEPLLPEGDPRAEVEALWATDGAVGAIAVDAFMIATRKDDEPWGPNAWIELAGHAARDPELVRDLYAFLAVDWIAQGRRAHYAVIPARDEGLRDAWFRLGFGAQQALGILEVGEVEWPDGVREATEDDVEALVELEPLLQEHQSGTPIFSPVPPRGADEIRADLHEELADETIATLVAESGGRIVGNFTVVPIELSSSHSGLARPQRAALLAFAVTLPEARGSGAGVALTQASFAWAHEHGYETMVTDWRVTNLRSSRFWPRRGFRTSFLRLHRLI